MSPGTAVALALLLDGALLATLLARSRAPLGVPRLLVVLAAGGLFALAQGLACSLLLRRHFLTLNLLHAFLFFALPAFGALVAASWPWRAGRAARAFAGTGALLLAALGLECTWFEPRLLVTERAAVALDPARAGRTPLRIGVLADLQCEAIGDHERAAVERLMAERPDLILLPGDFAQPRGEDAYRRLFPELADLLATLRAPLGVYGVIGDTDPPELTAEMLRRAGAQLLRDEVVELVHGDRRLTLAGLAREPGSPQGRALLERLAAPGGDDLRVLVAHRPDWALELPPGGRIDLLVAGHTHGGQVRLPWLGPPITLSRIPRRMAGGGLFELGGSPLYVSRGVGCERGDAPRIRFNCPPEIALLTLETAGSPLAGR